MITFRQCYATFVLSTTIFVFGCTESVDFRYFSFGDPMQAIERAVPRATLANETLLPQIYILERPTYDLYIGNDLETSGTPLAYAYAVDKSGFPLVVDSVGIDCLVATRRISNTVRETAVRKHGSLELLWLTPDSGACLKIDVDPTVERSLKFSVSGASGAHIFTEAVRFTVLNAGSYQGWTGI